MPAVLGAGAGDVDEVLTAGRRLARAGFALTLYRRPGRPLPFPDDARWAWPPLRRAARLAPRGARAVTIAPAWGVTCAPARAGPLGRPGPWADETADIERRYGPGRVAHVSLEEFARTLTPREQNLERLREGGVPSRALAGRLARARALGEVEVHDRAYRSFRAFDRPRVLHLFPTFQYRAAFARAYPEAVQVGPLWPGARSHPSHSPPIGRDWVWYASPASAERVAPAVVAGLATARPRPRLRVRSPRPWPTAPPGVELGDRPVPPARWRREMRRARVRIVTGSRSLLEAVEDGGPFLYFNGVIGTGPARRRHRPEKIVRFLELARGAGWPTDLCRDLSDFSRGRRVAEVVGRAARGAGAWGRFPARPTPRGFAPGFEDAGAVLVRFARKVAATDAPVERVVAEFRGGSHR